MSTYTEHKLTEHQLKFLSQIVNKRQRNYFSPTMDVLRRNGLIVMSPTAANHGYDATDAGRSVLAQARAEGW